MQHARSLVNHPGPATVGKTLASNPSSLLPLAVSVRQQRVLLQQPLIDSQRRIHYVSLREFQFRSMSLDRFLRFRRVRVSSRWLLAPAVVLGCSGRSTTTIVYQVAAGGVGATTSTVSSSTPNVGGQATAAGGSTGGSAPAATSGGAEATNTGGTESSGDTLTGGASPVASAGGGSVIVGVGGAASIASGGATNSGSGGVPSAAGGSAATGGAGPYVCAEQPRDPLAAPCGPCETLWRGHCYTANFNHVGGCFVNLPGQETQPEKFVWEGRTLSDDWAWGEAACQLWGGHLATINCEDELLFLRQFAHETQNHLDFFVGGFRTADGSWHWADGSPWGYEPETWNYASESSSSAKPCSKCQPTEWQRIDLYENDIAEPRWDVNPFWSTAAFICERTAR